MSDFTRSFVILCCLTATATAASETWSIYHSFGTSVDTGQAIESDWTGDAYASTNQWIHDPPSVSRSDAGGSANRSTVASATVPPNVNATSYSSASLSYATPGSSLSGANNVEGTAFVGGSGLVSISHADSTADVRLGTLTGSVFTWTTVWEGTNSGGAIDSNPGNGNAHQVLIDPFYVLVGDPDQPEEIELFDAFFESTAGVTTRWTADNLLTITPDAEVLPTGIFEINISEDAADGPSRLTIPFVDGEIVDGNEFSGSGIFSEFRGCLERQGDNGAELLQAINEFPLLLDPTCTGIDRDFGFDLTYIGGEDVVGVKYSSGGSHQVVGRDVSTYNAWSLRRPNLVLPTEDNLIPATAYHQAAANAPRPAITNSDGFDGIARSTLTDNADETVLLFDRTAKQDTSEIAVVAASVDFRNPGADLPSNVSFGLARTATYGTGAPIVDLKPFEATTVDGLVVEIIPEDSIARLFFDPNEDPVEAGLDSDAILLLESERWNRAVLTVQNVEDDALVSVSLINRSNGNEFPIFEQIELSDSNYTDDDRLFVAAQKQADADVLFDLDTVQLTRLRRGDVNRDAELSVQDLDTFDDFFLAQPPSAYDFTYDLNVDTQINDDDLTIIEGLFPQVTIGDFNQDGTVSFPDFLILSGNYGEEVASRADGDADGDGSVDFPDFLILSENFGTTQPIPAVTTQSVPEPASASVFACSLLWFLVVCRHASTKFLLQHYTRHTDYGPERKPIHTVNGEGSSR